MLLGCLGQPGVSAGQLGYGTAQPHAAAELPPYPSHHGPAASSAPSKGQG